MRRHVLPGSFVLSSRYSKRVTKPLVRTDALPYIIYLQLIGGCGLFLVTFHLGKEEFKSVYHTSQKKEIK